MKRKAIIGTKTFDDGDLHYVCKAPSCAKCKVPMVPMNRREPSRGVEQWIMVGWVCPDCLNQVEARN